MRGVTIQQKKLRNRLIIIVSTVFVLPSLVLYYIFQEQQANLSPIHIILSLLIIALVIIGITLIHYVFDEVSTTAELLKKSMEDDKNLTLNLHQEVAELNEITFSFNSLMKRLDKTTESLNQTIEELHKSNEKCRNIIENIEEGYYEVDLAGNFTFVNTSMSQILGYSRDELKGMNNRRYMDKEYLKRASLAFNEVYKTGIPKVNLDGEVMRKDGQKVLVEISVSPIKDSAGHATGFCGIVHDITERKRMEEALKESEKKYRELSMIDDLTQLCNSRYFHQQLRMEIDRVNRYGQPLTLLLLDLDDFKSFNDAHGHVEGDQVLFRIGPVVKRCLRQTDSAYRYGGEEFTVILPMTTKENALVIAERIRKEFKKEIFIPDSGKEVHITVSIGLAQYKLNEDIKVFVHRVDQLMYQGNVNRHAIMTHLEG